MRRMKVALAAVVAIVGLGDAARAEDGQPQDDRARIERLEREVEALKAQQQRRAPQSGTGTAQSLDKDARLEWGYKNGFYVKGEADGMPYEIRPRARAQFDYRGFDPDQRPGGTGAEDRFVLRRTRVGFDGSMSVFGYQLEVDPPRSGTPLGDFWIQYQQFEEWRVRMGHYKTPWSVENGMTSDL